MAIGATVSFWISHLSSSIGSRKNFLATPPSSPSTIPPTASCDGRSAVAKASVAPGPARCSCWLHGNCSSTTVCFPMVVRFPAVRAYSGTPFAYFVYFVVNNPLLGGRVLDGTVPTQKMPGVFPR